MYGRSNDDEDVDVVCDGYQPPDRSRECVTRALPKDKAEKIRTNLLLKPYKNRDYTHPKVEVYQEDLFDNKK